MNTLKQLLQLIKDRYIAATIILAGIILIILGI